MKDTHANNSDSVISYDQPAEDYWMTQLAGELPVLNFPTYSVKTFNKTYRHGVVNYPFPNDILERMRSFSAEMDSSLFAFLMTGVHILLFRYTRQHDLLTSTFSDAMQLPDGSDMLDLPVDPDGSHNMLLLRTVIDKEDTIRQLLRKQQTLLRNAYQYRDYPFELLSEKLRANPDAGFHGLPEICIAVEQDQHLTPGNGGSGGITFSFHPGSTLYLSLEYDAAVYDGGMMRRMVDHYLQVVVNMMADPAALVRNIAYLTAVETTELLSLNNNSVDYPRHKTIVDLFREQAIRSPDGIAVAFEGHTRSYKELDTLSDQLADYLCSKGVKRNDRVLICFNTAMDRSLVAILGVMKTCAAYVPVDSDLPRQRIDYLAADTGAAFVVTNRWDSMAFENTSLQIIHLDDMTGDWANSPSRETLRPAPQDLAYVIYTSGTTGDPKGAMISHQNLLDYFFGIDNRIGIAANKTNCIMSTLATDLGNTIIFGSLIYGNTLHLFSKDTLRNAEHMHAYFEHNPIDCIKIVPTHWNALEYDNKIILPHKMIIFGGEQLSNETVSKIRNTGSGVRIINHYGPTETTIGKLLYEVEENTDDSTIPVGQPFSNTRIYIVDEELSLCARGIWGELLIGGDGVFQGYLNNPVLTGKKLIPDKWMPPGERLYRTGDLVRINASGQIEFGSRIDEQVKIQGHRIELRGVEAFIRQYPPIKQCLTAVIEHEQAGRILVAYLEVTEQYVEEDCKTWLKDSLPPYMIPSILIRIPGLPMTSNGKVDKKKLSLLAQAKATANYEAPQNKLQAVVVGLLEEMFNRRRISIHDDFYELGGDSIKSIQLASRLRQRGYLLQLKDIFRAPVIKDFAALVKINPSFKVKEDMFAGSMPLSPIQRLFFEQKKGNYDHYNQSVILHAREIDGASMLKAFEELVRFHDTLRIRFRKDSADQWQPYYEEQGSSWAFESVPYTGEDAFRDKIAMLGRSLAIQTGPLARICLFKGEGQDILFIVIHHLLIDGVSFRILIEDLSALYNKFLSNTGFALRHKSSSLKEWHTRLLEYAHSETLSAEYDYWQKIDQKAFDRIRPLHLPPHPPGYLPLNNTIADRKIFSASLPQGPTSELIFHAYRKYSAETIELLLTALCHSLHEAFQIQRIMLNLEGHGREYIGYDTDISRTLGWFTTIFPVYMELHPGSDYRDTLSEIKDCLDSIPVKGIGYGVLKFLKGRSLDVIPEITFNYLGDFSPALTNGTSDDNVFQDVKFNYQDAAGSTTCQDILNITCILEHQGLSIYIQYNKQLFTDSEIKIFGNAYTNHLLKIIDSLSH